MGVVVTKLGSHPPTYPKFILYRYRTNHSTNKTCLPSLIPQKSRSSAFVQSEERSQPLPPWPPRSVHWVCLPKKLVTTSPSHLRMERLEGHSQIDHSKSSS